MRSETRSCFAILLVIAFTVLNATVVLAADDTGVTVEKAQISAVDVTVGESSVEDVSIESYAAEFYAALCAAIIGLAAAGKTLYWRYKGAGSKLVAIAGQIDIDKLAEISEKIDLATLVKLLGNVDVEQLTKLAESVDIEYLVKLLGSIEIDQLAEIAEGVNLKVLAELLDQIGVYDLAEIATNINLQEMYQIAMTGKRALDDGSISEEDYKNIGLAVVKAVNS